MAVFEDTSVITTTRPMTGMPYTTVTTVGTTPVLIVPENIENRRYVLIQVDETSTVDIYFGGFNVTTAASGRGGIQVHPGGFLPLPLGSGATWYAVSSIASQLIRVVESA